MDAGRAGVGDQRGGDKIPCLFACFLLVKPFSFHGKENSLKRTIWAKVLLGGGTLKLVITPQFKLNKILVS